MTTETLQETLPVNFLIRSADGSDVKPEHLQALRNVPAFEGLGDPVGLSPTGELPATRYLLCGSMSREAIDRFLANHSADDGDCPKLAIDLHVSDSPMNPVPSAEWYEGYCCGALLRDLGLQAVGTPPRTTNPWPRPTQA
jgi:hypothetical protein